MVVWNRSDVVEVETWCQSDGRIGTRRDWILKDYANGEVIGRATRYFKPSLFCPSTFVEVTAKDQREHSFLI